MKKKIVKALSVMLVVALTLTVAPLSGFVGLELPEWLDFSIKSSAATSGTCGENVIWSFDESAGMLTISGNGEMYNYGEGGPFEKYCDSIKTVDIEYGVTSISDYAFSYCENLTSITIPDSITSIGQYAFEYCTSLTRVTIPDSVTIIGECAFVGCTSLINIIVGNNNPSFLCDEYGVLFNKDKTTLIQYPVGNTKTSYTIPNSVTTIDGCAFANSSNLTSLIMPNSVTSIGGSAFQDCTSLVSVTIPNSVTSIGDFVFNDCTSLVSITIPDSVISIGFSAFGYCSNLESVTIGDNVTLIGDYAFFYCTSLTSITIPDSVTKIGEGAFYNCTSLTDVYYNGTEEQWNAITIDSNNDSLLNATIHYDNINNTTINISKEYEQQAMGTNFSISAFFSSDVYSPGSVTYSIEGESDGLIVDGGLSWVESELDDNLNIISYVVSLPLKAIKKGTYTVKLIAPDGTFDSIVIIVNEVSSTENGTVVGVLNSYEELIVVIQDDQEGNLGEVYNTVSSITVDGLKYNVKDYKKISLSHIESLKNKEVVFNISDGCVTDIISFDEDNFKATISIDSFDVEYKDGIRRKKVHEFSYRIYNSIVNIYNDDYVNAIAKYCQEKNKYCLQNIFVTFTLPNMDVMYFKDGMFGKKAEITFPLDGEVIYPNSFYDSICKIRAQKEHGFNSNETFGLELWGTVNGDINEIPISNVVNSFTANLSNTVTPTNPKPEEIEWNEITIYEFLKIIQKDVLICDWLTSGERALLSNEITKVLALYDFTKFDEVLGTIEVAWDMSGDFYGVKFKTAESVGKVYLEALIGEIRSEMYEIDSLSQSSLYELLNSTEFNTYIEWYEAELDENLNKCTNKCPTDIKVTDSDDGYIVLEITNNVITKNDSSIYAFVVDNEKFFYLPTDTNYKIEIIATDSGTMDYSVTTHTPDGSKRVIEYNDIVLTSDTTYVSNVPAGTIVDANQYNLTTENGNYITPTKDSCDEDEPEYNYTFSIQTPSKTTISKKNGIILHANVEGTAPDGSYVVWTSSNNKFTTSTVDDNSLKIISNKNGYTTFTATLYSTDGEILATDSIEMRSKAGFFDVIASWFRKATVYES